jgi:hypothetical protein
MADQFEIPPKSRRAVVKTMGQVAVSAPAVAMLLSATSTSAAALTPYMPTEKHILDDFTFGDVSEDIDAIALGSNFNPNNNTPQQDDHI